MNEEQIQHMKTGTTTVGLVCSDAIVLGADKKATMGYLVANKKVEKIKQLAEHIAMTIAGVVGDALALERYIKAELTLYRLREGRRIRVDAAAQLIANIMYSRRFYPYIVQLVVGGFDDRSRLFSFAPDGSVLEEDEFYSSGSGSPMAFGVLENSYRKEMSLEEGKKLVARAIKAATQRDIASGGDGIDLVVIDSKGFRRVPKEDVERILK